MSPALQRAIGELQQLTLEEQWKLLRYLIERLQASVPFVAQPPAEAQAAVSSVSVDALLAETRRSWGDRSIEEIDTALQRQRQIDWGEERRLGTV